MRTISLFAVIILILSNVVTAQPAPEQTWGLCIGVSEYDPDALALKWADKDATEFSTFLRYGLGIPEEHYRLLRNRDATRENILEHLGWLNIVARPGDRVYIFYSGHGKQNSPILPYDSYNLLSLERIKRALSKIDAQDVIFFADACYSGKLAGKGARAAIERENLTGLSKGLVIAMAEAKKDLVIITSANGIQEAHEFSEQKNGIFTYHLMKALMDQSRRNIIDWDKDGKLTLYEVYQDVYRSVADISQQEPQISDLEKAKGIVLLSYSRPIPIPPATPELPPTPTPIVPPEIVSSFDDLEVQVKWQEYLDEMEDAFSKVDRYEEGNFSAESKIAAWERFIDAFSGENPYSTRDEELRDTAQARIQFWKARMLPTPTPIPLLPTPTPIPTPTPLPSTPTPVSTAIPQPPTPIPTASPEPVFRLNSVVITNVRGKLIHPVNGIYALKAGESVTITVNVAKSQDHPIRFTWTTGYGKLSSKSKPKTTYTAKKSGSDYVLIRIEDKKTGETLQKSLNMSVVALPTSTPIPQPLTPTPTPTATPQPSTPTPTATPEPVFGINKVVITDSDDKVIDPVDGIYTLKAGESVTITVDVTKPQEHMIRFTWTAGHGKLLSKNKPKTTYTAKKSGGDYVLIRIENKKTGETLQKSINITVVP